VSIGIGVGTIGYTGRYHRRWCMGEYGWCSRYNDR